ncbi:MAG: hypothetical protein ACPGQL_06010 [Thermoplasmatota archaeon]
MRVLTCLVASLFLLGSASAAGTGDAVALGSGNILVGTPVGPIFGTLVDGVDGYFIDIAGLGLDWQPIRTSTVDNGGLGYAIGLYFFADDGSYLGGCARASGDIKGRCHVQPGSATVEVTTYYGHDLNVDVFYIDRY